MLRRLMTVMLVLINAVAYIGFSMLLLIAQHGIR
jgi:hypothetical protein